MRLPAAIRTRHGWLLLLACAPLCTAGVLTIHATAGQEPGHVLGLMAAKQIVFLLVGLAAALAIPKVNYERLGRYAYLLFALCLVLLAYLAADRYLDLPFVTQQRNARRWLRIAGAQVQPSELAKIAYVLALAWYLRYRRNYRTLAGLIAPFAITLVPMALIKMQPDLGTVLLFPPVLLAMLFAAGARMRHLVIVVLLGAACLPVFWRKIETYQRLRIAGVLLQVPALRDYFERRPERWDALVPAGADLAHWRRELGDWESRTGYQLVQSKIAIGSGGVLGHGFRQGIFVDYNFLPEKHNDFIFAMLAHQWGLIGTVLAVACYIVFLAVGFDIAANTDEPFGRLLAVGLSAMIAVQAATNLCMTVGIGPITGVTLPFVSAGGSSLIASLVSLGLLMNVARHRPLVIARKPFEFDEDAETE